MRQVPPPDPLDYVVLADNGQRASVVLPDGTKVWLNSHTKLNYKSDYGVKEDQFLYLVRLILKFRKIHCAVSW